MNPPTITQALIGAKRLGLDLLDAQLLLLHALGRPAHARAWLLSHDTDSLLPSHRTEFEACVQRRRGGEPLAYITGHKEFFGIDLVVDARVLVPRPDTETLVQWALDLMPGNNARTEPLHVLDLGTGSGAIALALKTARADLQVSAIDRSEDALAVARENASRLQLDVRFMPGCWLDDLAHHQYHAIVSNPPYIAVNDPHLRALEHEPAQALTSGADGLDDIRHIIGQASSYLQPDGWLLLEHGYDQAHQVRRLLLQAGLVNVQSRRDLSGIERCSGGQAAENPRQFPA
ncbi:MAG: peptide chain release factor N(5)-glutamine methyltransferase [Rhodoferax sp.]